MAVKRTVGTLAETPYYLLLERMGLSPWCRLLRLMTLYLNSVIPRAIICDRPDLI